MIALLAPNWLKNAFVLAPLLFAKKMDADAIVSAVAATSVFCLVASAIYVVNDWCDRAEDAEHPRKRFARWPPASSTAARRSSPAPAAWSWLPDRALASLPAPFWAVLAIYVAINMAYSLRLRHVQLVDVLVIAAGFVLRVLAGTPRSTCAASQFIVLSTGLLALLLAMGKRRTDLLMETADSRGAR